MKHDIANLSLATQGKLKIEWAGQQMPVLGLIKERFAKEKPLAGVRIGACLHVTSETANLMLALRGGGAKLALCASNPLSTQDEVAASLVKDFKIPVFAKKGEDNKTYYSHIKSVLSIKPNVTMDDGADLISELHKFEIRSTKLQTPACQQAGIRIFKFEIRNAQTSLEDSSLKTSNSKRRKWQFFGSSEETTTGVIRLKAMEKDSALKVPVIAVNDSRTKYLFDNRYGTGQSTIDGVLRATNLLLAGKNFVVCGYGWCGRGIAWRAKGMGANVIVCEVDPIRGLEALMDGFRVMKLIEAAKIGDILITSTGDKNVIDERHLLKLKDGAILANAGHFNVEINLKALKKMTKKQRQIRLSLQEFLLKDGRRVYLLGEGRLVNLAAAEGHPPEVMDMSFANQALAAEFFVKNKGKLEARVYHLPEKLDHQVALLKLKAMGVGIDHLTAEQKKYLGSWKEGT